MGLGKTVMMIALIHSNRNFTKKEKEMVQKTILGNCSDKHVKLKPHDELK
jgi:hypothetical protein